jgi:hypothetical protein
MHQISVAGFSLANFSGDPLELLAGTPGDPLDLVGVHFATSLRTSSMP